MKIFLFIQCLFIGLSSTILNGQNYQIINVDPTNFPIVEAHFMASGSEYTPSSLYETAIAITDSNQNLKLLELTVPKVTVNPASIVLVLDVSTSMIGRRFEALKKTAVQFIEMLPLEVTEVAIASFNNEIALKCDFTHNLTTLASTIDDLTTMGGTDYNNAFLTPFSGAVHVASQGKYKKLVVFITDGLSDVKEFVVTNAALADSICISSITIGLPISDKLKYISNETGGQYYSNLTSEEQIADALKTIYTKFEINSVGYIKWKDTYSCNALKFNTIDISGQKFQITYKIPENKLGYIESLTSMVLFDKGKTSIKQVSPLLLQGKNIELNIASIKADNPAFSVENIMFPIRTAVNEIKQIPLVYTPIDTIYTTTKFTIVNWGCPDVIVDAASGGTKKLSITAPTSHNSYNRGALIPIQWKGIDKITNVEFYYQLKNKLDWERVGVSKNYLLNWKAPMAIDSIRIRGQVTNHITMPNLLNKPLRIMQSEPFKKAFYNGVGTDILTLDSNNILSSWDAKSGELKFKYENSHAGKIGFYPDYNRLVSVSDSNTLVYTNRNGLLMLNLGTPNKHVLTSFTHLNGEEIYASISNRSKVYAYMNENHNSNSIELTGSPISNYSIEYRKDELLIYQPGSKRKNYKIKLSANFNRAIQHHTKPVLLIETKNDLTLFNMKLERELKHYFNESFVCYTQNGNYFISTNGTHTYINNIESGKRLLTMNAKNNYAFSNTEELIAFTINDSIKIFDLKNEQVVWQFSAQDASKLQFFPKTSKLLYLYADSLGIAEYKLKNIEFSTFVEPLLIESIQVSPNESSILVCTKQLVTVWAIEQFFDADTTSFFRINTPKPNVLSQLSFNKQYVGCTTEKMFFNAIQNNTLSNIIIDSVYLKHTNDFTLVAPHSNFEITAGNQIPIELQFTPQKTGLTKAELVLVSSQKQYPCTITGIGINKEYRLLSNMINFGTLPLNTVADTLIPVLLNSGSETINLTGIRILESFNNSFVLANSFPAKLKSNDTLWAKIQFKPQIRGRQSSQLQVKIDHNSWQTSTLLNGEGLAKRTVVLKGKTINRQNRKAIKSTIYLTELYSGNNVNIIETNSMGDFNFEVKTDLNYSISAQLSGYFSSSENIDLRDNQFTDTIYVDIELTPILADAMVKLNNIFFDFGDAQLLDISKPEIDRIADLLKRQANLKIEIYGHTDNVGGAESNLELSKNRAFAVKTYLVHNNIEQERISVRYMGEKQPVASNDTEQGRKANRRVEIKFIN